jgi:hypothetical protein
VLSLKTKVFSKRSDPMVYSIAGMSSIRTRVTKPDSHYDFTFNVKKFSKVLVLSGLFGAGTFAIILTT